MNRKNLTAAVLAGLAGAAGIVGSAQAVNVNPDGLGQVLLYPYYTTNAGNTTALSVVNTTGDAKAVKVRFLEGENSREVLDFNLYLSEYDVWTAALYDDAGTPTMVTGDTSCTVPYIYGNGGTQEFLPFALNDAGYNDLNAKGKPSGVYDDISRGAEGHFEIIEMGTLTNDAEVLNSAWVDTVTFPQCNGPVAVGHPVECLVPRAWSEAEVKEPKFLTAYSSADAATHDDGVPEDCQQLVDAWTYNLDGKGTDGYWITDPGADITAPSGGLFGGAAVINVESGTMYAYDATAIDGFWADPFPPHEGAFGGFDEGHQEPGTILPSLDSGGNPTAVVFGPMGDVLESGHLLRGVDAVSYVLMHDAIMNEYTTEAAVGAGTEWVITFPTKQFYVHEPFLDDYADFRDNGELDGSADYDGDMPLAPFTSEWFWTSTTYDSDGDVKKDGFLTRPCEVVRLDTIWDREEREPTTPDAPPGTPVPPIVSPAPPPVPGDDPDAIIPFELCYETSVIQFGAEASIDDTTAILGSRNFHNIDNASLGFEYGWVRLDMADATADYDGSGVIEDDEKFGRDPLPSLTSGDDLVGLPVTGFAVQAFENNFLGEGADVLANYGGIFQHKGTRSTEFVPSAPSVK
jgi:hypothetical protein